MKYFNCTATETRWYFSTIGKVIYILYSYMLVMNVTHWEAHVCKLFYQTVHDPGLILLTRCLHALCKLNGVGKHFTIVFVLFSNYSSVTCYPNEHKGSLNKYSMVLYTYITYNPTMCLDTSVYIFLFCQYKPSVHNPLAIR